MKIHVGITEIYLKNEQKLWPKGLCLTCVWRECCRHLPGGKRMSFPQAVINEPAAEHCHGVHTDTLDSDMNLSWLTPAYSALSSPTLLASVNADHELPLIFMNILACELYHHPETDLLLLNDNACHIRNVYRVPITQQVVGHGLCVCCLFLITTLHDDFD